MLTLFNPFNDLMRDDDFWGRWGAPLNQERAHAPLVDVVEEKDAFVLKAEMPGFKPEEIDVSVDGNVLTLKGERKQEEQKEQKGYRRIERRYGSFQRQFTLPDTTKTEAIDASLNHGVLTVRVPKREAAVPRKITVNAEAGGTSKVTTNKERAA